jgi:hypothetical protein
VFDGTSKSMSLVRTGGGVGIESAAGATNANWGFYIQGIAVSLPLPFRLIGSLGGWNDRKTKVKIERMGNIITAQCTDFFIGETVPSYDSNSLISINLEDYSEFSPFYTSSTYGYVSFSQENSTYLSVEFTGGLNLNKVYDAESNQVYLYDPEDVNGPWITLPGSIQDDIGYPIYATNPETLDQFFIEQSQITKVI